MKEEKVITEEYIRQYIDTMMEKDLLTEHEKAQFIQTAVVQQLDPFKREIYAIKYNYFSNKTNRNEIVFNLVTGYEVYLKRANASGVLAGWEVKDIKDGNDIKACITIHRKDWTHPFYHEVWLREYRSNKDIWRDKPITMIKKIAMSQGFRLAFPLELGGLIYTAEEMAGVYTNDMASMTPEDDKSAQHDGKITQELISTAVKNSKNTNQEDPNTEAPTKDQMNLIEKVLRHCQYNQDQIICVYDSYKVPISGPETKKQAYELLKAWTDPETKKIDYKTIKTQIDLYVFGEIQEIPAKEVLSWEEPSEEDLKKSLGVA